MRRSATKRFIGPASQLWHGLFNAAPPQPDRPNATLEERLGEGQLNRNADQRATKAAAVGAEGKGDLTRSTPASDLKGGDNEAAPRSSGWREGGGLGNLEELAQARTAGASAGQTRGCS